MYDADHIYSWDLETDNSQGFGLTPRKSRITQAALTTSKGNYVFEHDNERKLLHDFVLAVLDLKPGLLVGWNSAFFDLPWVADRADELGTSAAAFGLTLIPQPGLKPKYDYTPGHTTAYTALWESRHGAAHSHFDISIPFKGYAASFGVHPEGHPQAGKPVVPWSLKPVCKAKGIDMFEIDRTRLHEYSLEDQRRYVCSDTHGTRELALEHFGLR